MHVAPLARPLLGSVRPEDVRGERSGERSPDHEAQREQQRPRPQTRHGAVYHGSQGDSSPAPRRRSSENGGLAEERLHLGEEVGVRVHLELRAEREHLRPRRRLEVEHDGRLARKAAHDLGELAHDARVRAARVDAQAHLPALRRRLERGHLERDELRLAVLVVDAALDEQARGRPRAGRARPR